MSTPLQLDDKLSLIPAVPCRHLVDDETPDSEDRSYSVSLARWQRERDALTARPAAGRGRLGVRVNGDDDLDDLGDDLPALALVVIEFPRFTDGRGYSLARRLRDRYGFRGELRATGDVLRDQLPLMARCGIDVFEPADETTGEQALAALQAISVHYQPADTPAAAERRLA